MFVISSGGLGSGCRGVAGGHSGAAGAWANATLTAAVTVDAGAGTAPAAGFGGGGANNKLIKEWRKVKVLGHAQEVLETLEEHLKS